MVSPGVWRGRSSPLRLRDRFGIVGYNRGMNEIKAHLGILISGRGSNMKAIVEACEAGTLPADVSIVVSNRNDAGGLAWAASRGIPTAVVPHRDYADRRSHDRAILEVFSGAGVDWVCLAGYMRLVSPVFVEAYRNRILNIHPSLLPAFPGLHAQRQAWDYGVRWTGCTVHLVDTDLDHGPIVAQEPVPVDGCETVEDLEAAILEREHRLYSRALTRLLTSPWSIEGRRVVFGGMA